MPSMSYQGMKGLSARDRARFLDRLQKLIVRRVNDEGGKKVALEDVLRDLYDQDNQDIAEALRFGVKDGLMVVDRDGIELTSLGHRAAALMYD